MRGSFCDFFVYQFSNSQIFFLGRDRVLVNFEVFNCSNNLLSRICVERFNAE